MKKIITLTLTLILAFTLVLSLVPSVYAEGPESTVDVKLYLWSETEDFETTLPDLAYGQAFSVNASAFLDAGERFVAWVVDGVRSDAPASTTFVATSNMKLSLIFAPEDEYAAVFVDTNGHVIDVVYVDDETEVEAPLNLPDKPGFELASPNWDKSLGLISEDTFYKIRYQLGESTQFLIGVVGGSATNDEPTYNDIVTLTPADPENFVAWLEGGQVVSFDPNYKFSALSDRDFEASEDELLLETTLVILHDVTGIRDGYHSFIGYIYLPDGYELVEAGLLLSDEEEAVVYDTADYVLKSSAFHPTTNEFLRSIEDENMTEFVRAYAVVRDAEDNLSTIYSFVEESDSEEFMVSFDTDGGTEIPDQPLNAGGFVELPADPVKEGFDFTGWFMDAGFNNEFYSGNSFETDITLYAEFVENKWAGWIPITSPAQWMTVVSASNQNNKYYLPEDLDFEYDGPGDEEYITYVQSGSGTTFRGVIDGNNKTIRNVFVSSSGYGGVIQRLRGAIIKNLVLENVTVIATGRAGILTSRNESDLTTIENITIINSSVVAGAAEGTGMIVGETTAAVSMSNITIIDSQSSSSGNVKNVGFVIGRTSAAITIKDLFIFDSSATSANTDTTTGLGGLIGYTNDASVVLNASNVYIVNSSLNGRAAGAAIGYYNTGTSVTLNNFFADITFNYVGSNGIHGLIATRNNASENITLTNVWTKLTNDQGTPYLDGELLEELPDFTWLTTNLPSIAYNPLFIRAHSLYELYTG